MTDRLDNDIASFLTPPPSKGVQFTQGIVLSWNNETLHNTIEWRGITLTDVPLVEGINALTIRTGDVVGMLGWSPENAKGVGSWWILGKLSNPGEQIADLAITAKLIRFETETGALLAFFGKEADGDPLWMLMYGGDDEQVALRIVSSTEMFAYYRNGGYAWRVHGVQGSQAVSMYDQDGNEVFGTDSASKNGMAKPYLNIPMVPSSGTSVVVGGPFWPAFTNAAYQEVMHCVTALWHPKISIGVGTSVTAGAVDWELRIDGVTAGSATGTTSATFDVPGWGISTGPGAVVSVQLFARNTSGTQSRVIVDRCYGRQS